MPILFVGQCLQRRGRGLAVASWLVAAGAVVACSQPEELPSAVQKLYSATGQRPLSTVFGVGWKALCFLGPYENSRQELGYFLPKVGVPAPEDIPEFRLSEGELAIVIVRPEPSTPQVIKFRKYQKSQNGWNDYDIRGPRCVLPAATFGARTSQIDSGKRLHHLITFYDETSPKEDW